jgi:hypothetical protein
VRVALSGLSTAANALTARCTTSCSLPTTASSQQHTLSKSRRNRCMARRQRANRTSPQEHTARGGLGRLLRLHIEGELRLLGAFWARTFRGAAVSGPHAVGNTGEPRERIVTSCTSQRSYARRRSSTSRVRSRAVRCDSKATASCIGVCRWWVTRISPWTACMPAGRCAERTCRDTRACHGAIEPAIVCTSAEQHESRPQPCRTL